MISKHEIGSAGGAAKYHDQAFSQDGVNQADNYYVGEKVSAIWQGKGAKFLGVEGQAVKKEDFVAFLEGKLKNPSSGVIQDLTNNSKGDSRQVGVDFTVAPPKSVSITGLVGNDQRVINAHLAANKRTMEWLEKNGSVIRVRDNQGVQTANQAGNLLYATVLHETNRNNEPQIHSHNVIVSAVYDEKSKKWRSLTNEQLYILRQGADTIYKSELAQGLQRAGYKLEFDKNGVDFEIAGMSREQIEAYSTRTVQIVKALKDRGIEYEDADFRQHKLATIQTRLTKHDEPRDILHSVWLDVAAVAQLNVNAFVNDSHISAKLNATTNEIEAATANKSATAKEIELATRPVAWAVKHLSEREQSFTKTDIELTALKFGKGGIDQIEREVDQQIKNGFLVDRGEGSRGAILLTTRTAVNHENEIVKHIREGIGKGKIVLTSEEEFKSALQVFEHRKSIKSGNTFKLSGEQVTAAMNMLMHGDRIQGVQGDAGTGKTAVLEFVREAIESKNMIPMGIASTSSAAKELEASSGIKSQTIAGFLIDREKALRLAQIELSDLQANLMRYKNPTHTEISRIEVHRLQLNSEGIKQGEVRYTFDNERGTVFKSPDDLRNKLGNFLLDVSAAQKNNSPQSKIKQESVLDRLRDLTMAKGHELAESLGRGLTTYEKTGTVEAIAARNALYLKKDHELSNLKFQIGTKQAEISNLETKGNKAGRNIYLFMDESSMTGTKDAVDILRIVKNYDMQLVIQGDIKQHGSVPAGRFFAQAQEAGMNMSFLQETRRFDKATVQTKDAALLMGAGKMAQAIDKLDRFEVKNDELSRAVAQRYAINLEQLKERGVSSPRVGVVTVTNNDRKAINAAVHDILIEKGLLTGPSLVKEHLDNPKLSEAEQMHSHLLRGAGVDHLVFRKDYKELGIKNKDVVQVKGFGANNSVTILNSQGKEVTLNPKQADWFTPMIMEKREYATGDKIEARAIIHFEKKKTRIDNGERGVISSIDELGATVKWTGAQGKERELYLNNNQLRMVDLAYARTTFKEQGATNDREIFAVSVIGAKVLNKEYVYIAGTRARGNTEIVTSDYETMLKNSGKAVSKTTAIDIDGIQLSTEQQEPVKIVSQENAKVQEKVIVNDNTKIKELEKQRTRPRDQGFVLE